MQMHITAEDAVLHATQLDNATARDFTGHMPLTLTLTDYTGTEKINQLPERLQQLMPHRAPNHNHVLRPRNLAIFYSDYA